MDRQNQPTSPQGGEHAKHEEKNKNGTLGKLIVPIVVFIIILAAALVVTKCTSVGGSGNDVSAQTLDRSASGGVGLLPYAREIRKWRVGEPCGAK